MAILKWRNMGFGCTSNIRIGLTEDKEEEIAKADRKMRIRPTRGKKIWLL